MPGEAESSLPFLPRKRCLLQGALQEQQHPLFKTQHLHSSVILPGMWNNDPQSSNTKIKITMYKKTKK